MIRVILLVLMLVLGNGAYSQCVFSFEQLEAMSKYKADEVEEKLRKTSFVLKREGTENGITRKHYFCANGNESNAEQLLCVSLGSHTKAITYETSDKKLYNNIVSAIKEAGYEMDKTKPNSSGGQASEVERYKKDDIKISTFNYKIEGKARYSCTFSAGS